MLAVVGAFTIALLKQHGHGQGVPGGAEPSTRGVCGYRPPRVPKLMPGGRKEKDPSCCCMGSHWRDQKPQSAPKSHQGTAQPREAGLSGRSEKGQSQRQLVSRAQKRSQPRGGERAAQLQRLEGTWHQGRDTGRLGPMLAAPAQFLPSLSTRQVRGGEPQSPPRAGGAEGERRSIKMRNDTAPALPLT